MFFRWKKEEDIGIVDAKKFLDGVYNRKMKFHKYSSFYEFTTENLREALGNYTDNDRILTILSSGDHVFNYLLKGASNIETFDINKVTNYFFKLKCAEIMTLSCEEYNNLSNRVSFDLTLKDLDLYRNFLDRETYLFWKYCILNADDQMYILSRSGGMIRQKRKAYNIYFEKENYDKLRSILLNGFSVSFHLCNVVDLPNNMNGKYSEVYLSNVFDYVSKPKETIEKLVPRFQEHLTNDGRIMLYGYGRPVYAIESSFEEKTLSNKQKVYTLKK